MGPSSSRGTRLYSDDFDFGHQDIDSDMDDFKELDRQAGAACLNSKKVTFDDNVTCMEPDATTVIYHLACKKSFLLHTIVRRVSVMFNPPLKSPQRKKKKEKWMELARARKRSVSLLLYDCLL